MPSAQRDIGNESRIGAGVERIDLADTQRPRRAVRAFGQDRRARALLQPRRERRMVAMRMTDENVADRPVADRIEQYPQMRIVIRTRIDHRQRLASNEIAVGAVEGERAGVFGGDALDVRRNGYAPAVGRVEVQVEFEGH